MKIRRNFRKLLLALGTMTMAVSGSAVSGTELLMTISAAEEKPNGYWGTAPYYYKDGVLRFGAGKARGTFNAALNRYVTRIECDPEFDTSELTTLYDVFGNFTKLEDISALADWDVSNVTNMYGAFQGTPITNVDALSSWNTGNVTSINSMFYDCPNLSDISGMANWDVSSLKDMNGAFQDCPKLTSLHGMENWQTTSLTSMSCTFMGDQRLSDVSALSRWQTSTLSNYSQTFNGTSISSLEAFKDWDTSGSAGFAGTFANCKNLTSAKGLENWKLDKANSLQGMFEGCSSLSDVSALASWQTPPDWTNIADMLKGTNVNVLDLSDWNTANLSQSSQNIAVPSFIPNRLEKINLSADYMAGRTNTNASNLLGDTSSGADTWIRADKVNDIWSSTKLLKEWTDDQAGWWVRPVTVEIVQTDGTRTSVSFPIDSPVEIPAELAQGKAGALSGWVDNKGNSYGLHDPYTATSAAGQTLQPVYSIAKTMIVFDANGGSGSMNSMEIEDGSSAKLPVCSFVKEGWPFTGWNLAADGSSQVYENEASVTAADENQTLHLYAMWEKDIDIARLGEAIEKALQINPVLDDFIETGKKEFQTQLNDSVLVLQIKKSQESVDAAASSLNQAMLNLRRIPLQDRLHDLDEWSDDYL